MNILKHLVEHVPHVQRISPYCRYLGWIPTCDELGPHGVLSQQGLAPKLDGWTDMSMS